MQAIQIAGKRIRIRDEVKTGFIATWIIGLLAHAYRFFNFLPIWDSMFNFTGVGATFYVGRCFLGLAGAISSKYDLPWVNGALSIFFISIVVMMLIDLFDLKSRLSSILLAGLVVSFPTVTSGFAYMFTADCYNIAFFLAVLAIWLTVRYKKGFIAGLFCMGFSIGIYQAYVSVAMTTVIVMALKTLLIDSGSVKDIIKKYYKCVITVVLGAVFYYVVDSAINAYYGIVLTGYQGIGNMGILSLAQYKEAFRRSLVQLSQLWCLNDGLIGTNKYGYANAAVMCGIALGTVLLIIKNKRYKDIPAVIATVFLIASLPFASYSINFVSEGVTYHTLMMMGVCYIYLLLLIFIEHGEWKNKAEQVIKAVGVLVLAAICYFNTVNANIAYNFMTLSYEKSYGVASNLLDRIDQLEEYPSVTKVAFMGSYNASAGTLGQTSPSIMGVSSNSFLWGDYHYISMWEKCFGRSFGMSSGDDKAAIMETEEYQNMPVYPAWDCVAVINDTIVVKLSE